MKLRKILIVITASTPLLFIAGCSSPLIYNSVWQDKPVTIDGKAKEWKIPLDYFDDKTKLNFSITNDKANLYFCIRATEDETQKGIIHSGLQICIDTTGGKKNDVGIQFPIMERSAESSESPSDKHSRYSSSDSPDETSSAVNLKRHYQGASKQIRLNGFTNATAGLAEIPNMYGINACLNWDTNNIMIYEVCIPFNTFYKASLSASDSAKVFGVSFIVTVTSKNTGGGHGGGDMGGPGGMGGMGGGMHGGGGHGDGESSSSTEALTAHIKFRLAAGMPPK